MWADIKLRSVHTPDIRLIVIKLTIEKTLYLNTKYYGIYQPWSLRQTEIISAVSSVS